MLAEACDVVFGLLYVGVTSDREGPGDGLRAGRRGRYGVTDGDGVVNRRVVGLPSDPGERAEPGHLDVVALRYACPAEADVPYQPDEQPDRCQGNERDPGGDGQGVGLPTGLDGAGAGR